jgi:hypothetical protein
VKRAQGDGGGNGVAIRPARCGLCRLPVSTPPRLPCGWTDPLGATDGSPDGRFHSPRKRFRRRSGLSFRRSPLHPPASSSCAHAYHTSAPYPVSSYCAKQRMVCLGSRIISGLHKFMVHFRSVVSSRLAAAAASLHALLPFSHVRLLEVQSFVVLEPFM